MAEKQVQKGSRVILENYPDDVGTVTVYGKDRCEVLWSNGTVTDERTYELIVI